MSTELLPNIKSRFCDANNAPLVGGKLYTYEAGTSTPLATYTDQAASSPNTNPIILDANGEAVIFITSGTQYKFILTDANDVQLWSQDNVAGVGFTGNLGTGDVVGPVASVNNEISLFSGTTGKVIKRASGTGFVKATAGVVSYVTTIDLSTETTGTVPLARGGTGQTTANSALNVLLPSQTSNAGKYLSTDGTDATWAATPTSLISAIDTAIGSTPSAAGMSVTSGTLTLQPADSTHPGLVTTAAQTIAGAKTFSGNITAANLSGTNTGDLTVAAVGSTPNANGVSLTSQVLNLEPASGTLPGVLTALAQSIGGVKTFLTHLIRASGTGITAFAGGGQSSATVLSKDINRVTTVATAGDSVKLPAAVAGMEVIVINDGASSLDIFPATGESIDALAANAAYALSTSLKNVRFICGSTGLWKTAAGAFVSPLTTKGDIHTRSSSADARLAVGSDGQVLTADAAQTTGVKWATPATGDVAGPASSVDSEVALFSGTTGKIIKRASGTGFAKLTSGVLSASSTVNAATELTGATPIANGGTGQTAKTAAFDALSPLTTSGDLLYGGASGTGTRLPKGTDGHVLTLASGLPSWAAATSGFTNPMTTGGDIIYGGASGTAARLANGSSGQVLTSAGGTSAPTWTTPAAAGSLAGFRNKLINGDMRIDTINNGATQIFTAGAALAYCVDNWYGYCTGANVPGGRVAGAGTSQYRYQFNGAASNTAIGFGQRIESLNCYDLNNTTATLSVDLANSVLTTVTWTLYRATTTADTFGTLASPTVTSLATGTFTVTSTVTNYTTSISIPSAATTGLQLLFTVANQTSGTWTIGNVQLEAGSTATAFERRPLQVEDLLCARYLPRVRTSSANEVYPFVGSAATTAAISGTFSFQVPARVKITGVGISAGGDFKLLRHSTGSLTASAVTFASAGAHGASIQWTVAGATTDQTYYLQSVNAGLIYFTGAQL